MKRWWLPIVLLITGSALAAAAGWGANAALGAAIALGEGESLDKVKPGGGPAVAESTPDKPGDRANARVSEPPTPRGMSRKQYIDGIMGRNIFDSASIGKAVEDAPPCEGDDCEFEASDLPVKVLATVVANPEQWSSALLFDENAKSTAGYGIGDKVQDATITRIEEKRVIVQRGDGREEFLMPADGEIDKGSSRTASSGAEPSEEGITKVDETTFVLDRSMVDTALGDLDSLSRMARARPHKDADGNVDGFRLSGVRRNKLGYKIGIRSGDVVHSVNGQSLTSLQEAMGAMESLKSGSDFEFEITRRGQKKTLKYQVR